jgi:ATP-dependent protease HslVU (ClpYQ) peptidase subunit
MDAGTLAVEALKIAGQICVYTNQEISVEIL